ncbi:hypothetical protein FE257_010435 [Aspergillus nanangensis]|uniref:Uncharacterized protein n=1 Tax=Aspergillus nanangensis TaxID=2582783 RepID=A0AAD4CIH6_ASPNN|nr:hypothetical protein FE257_010435 [Aspergillus nanangensis]
MRFTHFALIAVSLLTASAAPTLEMEERCCSGVCCDYNLCETGVGACVANCANITNAGGVAGCIAGMTLLYSRY